MPNLNNDEKAAPHVPHYDFNALLLIKMQIYLARAPQRSEKSGGKTDYVWGCHDKHRNMINSTQPHPACMSALLPYYPSIIVTIASATADLASLLDRSVLLIRKQLRTRHSISVSYSPNLIDNKHYFSVHPIPRVSPRRMIG